MKSIFRKSSGSAVEKTGFDIEEREIIYCLIQAPLYASLDEKDKIAPFLSNLFETVEKTNGDINQFCCDTLLILYGLPLVDENIFSNIIKLLTYLSDIREPIRVILGIDSGLYGPFGYEKRIIVTAITPKLIKDYHQLITLTENKIFVHKELAEKDSNIQKIKNVIIKE